MTQFFSSLDALVPFAKLRSLRGLYDGRETPANMMLMRQCGHVLTISPELDVTIIYTRDVGHHNSGWWKNPDYERCLHLSLGYRNPTFEQPLPHDRGRSAEIARAFFGDDARMLWIEGPSSPEGKSREIWHYRLFCNPAWVPILPRGEVYNRANTPADWKSFSEIHGFTPSEEQAPFLRAQGDAV